MKCKDIILDAATVVGCCVGVGFLSGKEAQLFFGNMGNVAIFAVVFFALNILVRHFCNKHGAFEVCELSHCCFGKLAPLFTTLFLLCCFVCVVTMFAGVENCLQSFFPTELPMYGMIVALISAIILKKGLGALKVLNVVSVVLALVYLTAVAIFSRNGYVHQEVSSAQPIKYALFSVTMSLGVLAPLSKTAKSQIAPTIVATVALSALIVFVLWVSDFSLDMPTFGKTDSVALNVLGGISIVLATVTGVAANTLPITQCIAEVFQDDVLYYVCLYCLALTFSMFGFDFALKYGYLFVAAVGILLTLVFAVKLLRERTTAIGHRALQMEKE